MKFGSDCTEAEILAGAIALGEAGDAQRVRYREHLSTCRRCLAALGGECEIERVINLVSQARDQERWQPDLRSTFARVRKQRRAWTWGAGVGIAAVFAIAVLAAQRQGPVVVRSLAMPAGTNASSVSNAEDLASLGTQAQPRREHRAESLVLAPEGSAARTVTFQVTVDRHGRPTRCTIIKRSGHARIDAAVCHVVMATR
jgi:hypothetical protein